MMLVTDENGRECIEVEGRRFPKLDRDALFVAVVQLTMLQGWYITTKHARMKEDFASIVNQIKDLGEIVAANVGWMMHEEEKGAAE